MGGCKTSPVDTVLVGRARARAPRLPCELTGQRVVVRSVIRRSVQHPRACLLVALGRNQSW